MIKVFLCSLVLVVTILAGCSSVHSEKSVASEKTAEVVKEVEATSVEIKTTGEKADTVSSASIEKEDTGLIRGLSKNGAWLVAIKANLESEKELTIEGDYSTPDKKDKTKILPVARKLVLYDPDEKRTKTASYILKAPRLTIESADTRIVGGTFIGDVYVEEKGFYIEDGKVEGNVYFKNEEAQKSFSLKKGATVSGVKELKK